ncbi:hypothetical protein B1222_03600 [Paenibacillus larvae subsp. pulvifaciens]|uniref:Uncharacterized protein n=2 Tax=Paenibacillus larvae TaxID=1464 RepID=V9WA71_9BACL|nr:hypothetical protein ERIC2_c22350 [Paenibacillus larvae subsp. larvae DSM 25430]AQR76474.1 hypothetical protein BXP28_02880 [Paenibacillus larvae subsp. larvae]AQT83699.1 hypothetical protein B1222_03600 [Paenibacillus larvae subsp. pulvifaciens]ETK25764.1 hypothetical protein ERIC1_3c00870 [Paenibacillus larvae subsp. larvae DSM 25719]MBH0342289.1 hypothetical protein [Paenibacillus larvae]
MYAQSIYEHGHAKVVLKNRKMKLQDSFVGTIKAKEAYAEVETYDLQKPYPKRPSGSILDLNLGNALRNNLS